MSKEFLDKYSIKQTVDEIFETIPYQSPILLRNRTLFSAETRYASAKDPDTEFNWILGDTLKTFRNQNQDDKKIITQDREIYLQRGHKDSQLIYEMNYNESIISVAGLAIESYMGDLLEEFRAGLEIVRTYKD
jgi:hypothetical protein